MFRQLKKGRARSNTSTALEFLLAMSKGVSSWQFLIIGLISGCSINNCKVLFELGHTAAKCNGVWLPTVGLLTFEPQFKRISTHAALFHRHAECSGVQPSSVKAFISAPALSNMIRDF